MKRTLVVLLTFPIVLLVIYLFLTRYNTSLSNPKSIWLSYRDQKYSFSFQYPAGWYIKNFDQDHSLSQYYLKRLTITSLDHRVTISGGDWGFQNTKGGQFNLVIQKNTYSSLDEITEQEKLTGDFLKNSINGVVSLKSYNDNSVSVHQIRRISAFDDPVIFYFKMSFDPERKEEFIRIFDRLLDSFQTQ